MDWDPPVKAHGPGGPQAWRGHQIWRPPCPDGEPGGRLVLGPQAPGKLSSSKQVGSLALTDRVSSATQDIPLALTGIDADPGGRLVSGPQAPGQCPSARCSAPSALKLRPFLAPWRPALSCVSFSTQVGPLALTDIDDETGGRLPLGPLFLGQCPSARCSAPGVLKLQPFLVPQSSALSCVSSSTQEGPLALTGIDGETGGRLVLGLLFLGQWPSACCLAPDALKLRPFLTPWSSALAV
ncbi:uncharacterized protein LOC129137185 [Pan troglodytes]|uniref:uncharacterized protein LOC129137185 n=1 Tax=Pan troglodytes TaxID=9598 RepID=UPI003013990A